MRRTCWISVSAAVVCLAACGSTPPPPIVFDATSPPLYATLPQVTSAGPSVAPGGPGTTPVAANTTTTLIPATSVVAVEPPTVAVSSSTEPVTTTTVSGQDTVAPTTTPTSPTTTPDACDLPGCSGQQLVAFPSLTSVTRLGDDPVEGSGCGLTTELGNAMPDGLWFGLVYPKGDSMDFDVVCAYTGDAARANGADAASEAFFPVNKATRQRTVPLSAEFVWRQGATTADGACTDTGPAGNAAWSEVQSGTKAWILVFGGEALGAVAMCPS